MVVLTTRPVCASFKVAMKYHYRYEKERVVARLVCPQCDGSGLSPYVDVNFDPIRCECCRGEGTVKDDGRG